MSGRSEWPEDWAVTPARPPEELAGWDEGREAKERSGPGKRSRSEELSEPEPPGRPSSGDGSAQSAAVRADSGADAQAWIESVRAQGSRPAPAVVARESEPQAVDDGGHESARHGHDDDRGGSGSARRGRSAGGGFGRGSRRGKAKQDDDVDPAVKAKEICYRLLAMRAHTRLELVQALRRREIPDDVAETVLGRFDAAGLIDDAAFARMWVRSRHENKGLGKRALAVELKRRGVDSEVVTDAVAAVDDDAEEERAAVLVRKRLRAMSGVDEQAKIRRLVGMLARKGYGPGVAYRVVRAELGAEGLDDADE